MVRGYCRGILETAFISPLKGSNKEHIGKEEVLGQLWCRPVIPAPQTSLDWTVLL